MDQTATFTGRSRSRKTQAWVRVADRAARALITLGGVGTIVAVLLVGVFLLAVALPLFRPTAARLGHVAPLPAAAAAGPVALGSDESGAVVWMLTGGADAGIRVVDVATGALVTSRSGADCGLADATAVKVVAAGLRAVVGYADGAVRTGRIGLESRFMSGDDAPAAARALPAGGVLPDGDRAVLAVGEGRFAEVRLVVELAEPTRAIPGPIVDVDVTQLGDGPLVAALGAGGAVRVETVTTRRNLLTDELVATATGATIDPEDGFVPVRVRLSELGDQLFLFAVDGQARRIVIRDLEAPVVAERFDVAPGAARVTAVERLFGGTSLAVADDTGTVRVYFPSRPADAEAADGLAMAAAKTFPADGAGTRPPAAVTALAASPRSRAFAVADADGLVRLLQPTTERELLRLRSTAPGGLDAPPALMCLTPPETRLVASCPGELAAWEIDTGHAEVSLQTLLMPVWYENYPGAVHAWETTGHEAFESKFGLVPLIFGTLKATLYSMAFATPIALLAAIYASQFLHPRWKARIKPTIEMMASLPSVVLGFMAGIVFAPFLERSLVAVLAGIYVVPLTLLAGAHAWQLLPSGWRVRLAAWRLPIVFLAVLPAGAALARLVAAPLESILFQGDLRAWLDGRGGSGFGGWVIALLPVAGLLAAAAVGRGINPWLRRLSAGDAATGRGAWPQRRAALASCGVFLVGVVAAVGLAVAAAGFLDAVRLDTRGGLFGTYVQRNAIVVALGMSFTIIPLVFTIAEDALSSVPEHLRSASLGAGATPWQTAVRVIVPAAASGLFSAVMIGLGRAVGETMIVLMAAGNTPLVSWNLFNGFQTLSAAIATELPEAARNSAHYRVLFLAALALFAITFVVNTAAEIVRQRFRRRSHEL